MFLRNLNFQIELCHRIPNLILFVQHGHITRFGFCNIVQSGQFMVARVDMSAQKQFGIRIPHSLPQLVGTESFTRYELFPVSISKSVARRWLVSELPTG